MKDRKKELVKVFENVDEDVKEIVTPMIDDVLFLEDQLKELKKLPFIRISKKDSAIQQSTPASKQYKELLQQYNNCIKILCSVVNKNGAEEESPLQAFMKSRV